MYKCRGILCSWDEISFLKSKIYKVMDLFYFNGVVENYM